MPEWFKTNQSNLKEKEYKDTQDQLEKGKEKEMHRKMRSFINWQLNLISKHEVHKQLFRLTSLYG